MHYFLDTDLWYSFLLLFFFLLFFLLFHLNPKRSSSLRKFVYIKTFHALRTCSADVVSVNVCQASELLKRVWSCIGAFQITRIKRQKKVSLRFVFEKNEKVWMVYIHSNHTHSRKVSLGSKPFRKKGFYIFTHCLITACTLEISWTVVVYLLVRTNSKFKICTVDQCINIFLYLIFIL